MAKRILDRELKGVPGPIRLKLEELIEQEVRRAVSVCDDTLGDTTLRHFTMQQVCVKLHSLIELARKFSTLSSPPDASVSGIGEESSVELFDDDQQ